jgi:hypothetical protein
LRACSSGKPPSFLELLSLTGGEAAAIADVTKQ